MLVVMCKECGNFLPGTEEGGAVVPIRDECPECGGSAFRAFENGDD